MRRLMLASGLLLLVGCGDSTEPVVVEVRVEPRTANVLPGGSQQFTAVVTPSTADPAVTWEVVEGEGYGTITSEGLYTAPVEPPPSPNLLVRARLLSDPGIAATAAVHIVGPDEVLVEAWRMFTAGEYDEAAVLFQSVLLADSTRTEARTGRGWTDLRRLRYDDARADLMRVLDEAGEDADAACGLVFVEAATGSPEAVQSRAEAFLAAAPDYVFVHDPSVAASDVRWFAARAALDSGDYASCAAHLDVLAPGHGLDPDAADFAERALALLETLQDEV